MKATVPFLRSVFAKRIFGLFILCALLPIGCLAFLSLREMSRNLKEQSHKHLHQAGKQISVSVLEGFSFLRTEMEVLALSYGSHPGKSIGDAGKKMPEPRQTRFLGLTFFPEESGAETVFGTPCLPPLRTEALRNHLASGQAAIFVQRVFGAPSRVHMALAPRGMMAGRGFWVGEIHPKHLRGIVENALPAQIDVTLLDSSGEEVYSSRLLPKTVVERVGAVVGQTSSGRFEWDREGDSLLVNYRSIFLKVVFLSEDWIVIASQSKADAYAPMTTLTRTFVLIAVLTILVVSLLSIGQIRRSLVPLVKLREGTQNISRGDFESRVEIKSGDEFEELANSFNLMSERLKKEFHGLTETGRIVRSVLTGLEKEKIVKTVLSNMQSVVPCDKVALFLIDSSGNGAARIYTDGSGSKNPADPRQTPAMFTPEELQRLKTTDGSLIVESGDEFLRLLAPISGNGALRFVLLPLLHKESLAGVLAMGYGPGSKQVREDLLRARQIGDQVVVGLANAGLLEELAQFNRGAMTALARAVDAKSPWTLGHSERVTALSLAIGRGMGLTAKELEMLQRGGMLHDIGKIGIPGSILDKPEKLTAKEFAMIQEHPEKGARILEPIPAFQNIIPIVTQHHERFDGKGYPRGLSGEAISLGARILAVADVYDALTSDRPYRVALRPEEAFSYVVENAGMQFDPAVTKTFRNIIPREEAMSIFRKDRPVSISNYVAITK